MSVLVADTSGLTSLAVAADQVPDPLALCLDTYDVLIPELVVEELKELSSYDDAHGGAAETVLDRRNDLTIESMALDEKFPLDDGENAAVTLANDDEAALLFCDEFNHLGLIHASLTSPRLVTTPTLLAVFVRKDILSREEALALFDVIVSARSWDANSYVQRARSLLEDS
jgi:predicted ribonuclease YlaK